MRKAFVVAALTLLTFAATSIPIAAQLHIFRLGRAPTAEEIRRWDVTIPPDGRGLPPGSGTAASGKAIYVQRCSACHGPPCILQRSSERSGSDSSIGVSHAAGST